MRDFTPRRATTTASNDNSVTQEATRLLAHLMQPRGGKHSETKQETKQKETKDKTKGQSLLLRGCDILMDVA